MNIFREDRKEGAYLSEIIPGEVFEVDDTLFMRLEAPIEDGWTPCVNLVSGVPTKFVEDLTPVHKVIGSLKYRRA